MEGKMREIEMKKEDLQKAFLSQLSADQWKDLQALLDFSKQNPCTKLLQNEKSGNPMREKLKGIDLNDGPCEDLAQVFEIKGEKLKKRVGKNEGWSDELFEIEGKMREIEFSKRFIEDRAKELELKEREVEDRFGYLEVKKMEFARKRDATFVEIEEQKLKLKEGWETLKTSEKEVERAKVLCQQRSEEISGKMREVDSSRQYIETFANGLELTRKELDNGFKELGLKNIEFTQMASTFAAINRSNAEKYATELELKLRKELENEFQVLKSKEMELTQKAKKVAAIHFSNEAYAKQLELKRKELENGFQELKSKEMELTQKARKVAAIHLSNAEYAKELELKGKDFDNGFKDLEMKRKELDDGFKKLETKEMEFAQTSSTFGAINFSNADFNMNQTKRHRSFYENSDSGEAFWTGCTCCKFKFMYHKKFVNNILKCRSCSKNFTAYELDAESIPQESVAYSENQMELFAKTNETAGVPTGAFELDPSSLPTDPNKASST